MSPLPVPFPNLDSVANVDRNPAIRLYGKRFFGDQTVVELLAEMMAVAFCEKRIVYGDTFTNMLPDLDTLREWPDHAPLQYHPPVSLNLKLFALLTACPVDRRHSVHRQHYEDLAEALVSTIRDSRHRREHVAEWLQEVLQGFQGAGSNRTWCAQTFAPVTPQLLTQETIWNDTVAKKRPVANWESSVHRFRTYYSTSRHRFLARGGELLYLQICNALGPQADQAGVFAKELHSATSPMVAQDEVDIAALHAKLNRGLQRLHSPLTRGLDTLIEHVEGLAPETHEAVNRSDGSAGWISCEWCPSDSWREGYLYALETSRILSAALDPIERMNLMMTGAALQVLRSLCAQSGRYAPGDPPEESNLRYAWIVAQPGVSLNTQGRAAHRSLQRCQALIQRALRHQDLLANADDKKGTLKPSQAKLYSEADRKYGHTMFLRLAKQLGFVIPPKGPGARFVMTDGILRYLVLALVRPNERCTYDDFCERLWIHYGIAVEGNRLDQAAAWCELPVSRALHASHGSWLTEALRMGGFLTELSDACSVVRNTYASIEAED